MESQNYEPLTRKEKIAILQLGGAVSAILLLGAMAVATVMSGIPKPGFCDYPQNQDTKECVCKIGRNSPEPGDRRRYKDYGCEKDEWIYPSPSPHLRDEDLEHPCFTQGCTRGEAEALADEYRGL
ncbi:hypothetical protein ACFLZH_02240 [Patescibacteria group bacterium]